MTKSATEQMTKDWFELYGWICPKCGRVYAPQDVICVYCNEKEREENEENEGH